MLRKNSFTLSNSILNQLKKIYHENLNDFSRIQSTINDLSLQLDMLPIIKLKDILIEFKKYIENTHHPKKFSKSNYLFNTITWITYSKAYNQLINLLNKKINKNKKLLETLINLPTFFWDNLKNIVSFIINQPAKSFVLLLLSSTIARTLAAKPNKLIEADTIHDEPVFDLSKYMSTCKEKATYANRLQDKSGLGVTPGKICKDNENKKFFLKEIKPTHFFKSSQERSATLFNPGKISVEKFNQQFVKEVLGLSIPNTKFFKDKINNNYYIGSEEVKDIVFPLTNEELQIHLTDTDMVKFAIATTFINDLHNRNKGYTKDSLFLIDVDGYKHPNIVFKSYLDAIHDGLSNFQQHSLPMSIKNIQAMENMYRKIKKIPLPKFYQDFKGSQDTYELLCDTFIEACSNTRQQLKMDNHDEANSEINDLYIENVRALVKKNNVEEQKRIRNHF